MQDRLQNFHALSLDFAALGDAELMQLIAQTPGEHGWGCNHVISLNDRRVFIKRIPLTQRKYIDKFSLANTFDLPSFYNYGFGSAGLGVFRELYAHIATTQSLLAGGSAQVPLLFHYRIVDATTRADPLDEVAHCDSVKFWANSAQIDTYLRARHQAPYELVLCLEYLPHCLGFDSWFSTNTHRIDEIASAMFKTLKDFRAQGILHFDCQFHNILTDGTSFFLTDFGLSIPHRACLNDADKSFYNQHRFYPEAVFLASCSWHLTYQFLQLPRSAREQVVLIANISDPEDEFATGTELLAALEQIADNNLQISQPYKNFLLKYREPIQIARRFTYAMINNDAKDTSPPNAKFEQALHQTGWA